MYGRTVRRRDPTERILLFLSTIYAASCLQEIQRSVEAFLDYL
jgi:hypothetical protein